MWAPVAGKALLLVKPLRIMSIPMRGVVWLPEKGAAKCDFCQCTPRAEGDCQHPVPHTQGTYCSKDGDSPASPLLQGNSSEVCPASLGNPFWEDLATVLHFCYWDNNQDCAWKGWGFGFAFLLIVPSFCFFSRQEFGSEWAHPLLQTGTANEITSFPPQNNLVEHRLICLSEVTCWLLPKITCKGLKSAAGKLAPNTAEAPGGEPWPCCSPGVSPSQPLQTGHGNALFPSYIPCGKAHTTQYLYRWYTHGIYAQVNKANYSTILHEVKFLTSLGFGTGLSSKRLKEKKEKKCIQLVFESMSFSQRLCFYQ